MFQNEELPPNFIKYNGNVYTMFVIKKMLNAPYKGWVDYFSMRESFNFYYYENQTFMHLSKPLYITFSVYKKSNLFLVSSTEDNINVLNYVLDDLVLSKPTVRQIQTTPLLFSHNPGVKCLRGAVLEMNVSVAYILAYLDGEFRVPIMEQLSVQLLATETQKLIQDFIDVFRRSYPVLKNADDLQLKHLLNMFGQLVRSYLEKGEKTRTDFEVDEILRTFAQFVEERMEIWNDNSKKRIEPTKLGVVAIDLNLPENSLCMNLISFKGLKTTLFFHSALNVYCVPHKMILLIEHGRMDYEFIETLLTNFRYRHPTRKEIADAILLVEFNPKFESFESLRCEIGFNIVVICTFFHSRSTLLPVQVFYVKDLLFWCEEYFQRMKLKPGKKLPNCARDIATILTTTNNDYENHFKMKTRLGDFTFNVIDKALKEIKEEKRQFPSQ